MRIIFLGILLSSSMSFAFVPLDKCLFGSEKKRFHADIVAGKNMEPGTFLAGYHQIMGQIRCLKPVADAKATNEKILSSFGSNDAFSKDCVRESMANIPNIKGTKRTKCSNDDEALSGRTELISGTQNDMCVTEQMVDYVHFAMNEAYKCVNSIAKHPIDPELSFSKWHQESSGGYYLNSGRGKGLGQLTTIAMKEMSQEGYSGGINYMKNALGSPACSSFHDVLSRPVEFAKVPMRDKNGQVVKKENGDPVLVERVRVCQLVNSQNGLARNLFFSMAAYAHKRDTEGEAIGKKMRKRGIFNENAINYLAFVAYGRNGQAKAETIFSKMVEEEGIKYLGTLSAERLIIKLDAMSDDDPAFTDRLAKVLGPEQSKVVTTDDIIDYLRTHEPIELSELYEGPGIAAVNNMKHEELVSKIRERAPYVNEIFKSYNKLLAKMGQEKGSRECYMPLVSR